MNVPTLETDLRMLRDKVLFLGGQSETALSHAARALIQRDSTLAKQVISDDDEIDSVESEIDELCAQILTRHRNLPPEDLRFVIGVLRTTPMIERIADHAVNIARHTIKLNDEPQLEPFIDLPRMAEIVKQMLAASLDALSERDTARAKQTIRRDTEVDMLYRRIFNELMTFMTSDLVAVSRSAELLFVIKHLERIADYVTNICEQVVYLAEGRAIKHTPEAWLGDAVEP